MALTKQEVEITRLMIDPEKADYMDALSQSDDFARSEIAAYQQKRLDKLAIDAQVNSEQAQAIEAEIALLS